MTLKILREILVDLVVIYKNAVTQAKSNDNYVLVGKLKKGDFYVEYHSLDDIRQLIKNTEADIRELEYKEEYKLYGSLVHNNR